jgi:transposase
MEYFAGLDVSMEETRVCILNGDGTVIREVKVPSPPCDIEAALAGAPAVDGSCSRPAAWPRCSITA